YKEPGDLDYQFKKIIYLSLLSCVTMAFFSLVFIAATYSNVCMFLTLGDDVRRDSILLKIVKNKILFYTRLLLIVNSLVGCVLLWAGEPFVAGLGFSWFATFIVSMLFLQGSLSRYMTPAVVSSLSKVKELLSASPK
ncbi:protein traS, partial [Salmonella enterica]